MNTIFTAIASTMRLISEAVRDGIEAETAYRDSVRR